MSYLAYGNDVGQHDSLSTHTGHAIRIEVKSQAIGSDLEARGLKSFVAAEVDL
jgi:hypothetical protein